MMRATWIGASLTLLLFAGCVPEDEGGFTGVGPGPSEDECSNDGHDQLVADAFAGDSVAWTCGAPDSVDSGPAIVGWSGVTNVLPGGFVDIELQVSGVDRLDGQQVVVANEDFGMHSRIELEGELGDDDSFHLQWLVAQEAIPGTYDVVIGLLQDFGDGGVAVGPSVHLPLTVMEVDDPDRGLRVHLLWSVPGQEGVPDLDLQVFEPSGERVSINDPETGSGAVVEHDGQTECSGEPTFEAISWPPESEAGRYAASAFVWDSCGYDGLLEWTLAFSRYDRLLTVMSGQSLTPHEGLDGELIDLFWIDIE